MRNAVLGFVVGIVLAVFGTLFYVNAISTVVRLDGRVTAIENFLNQQIKAAQSMPPTGVPVREIPKK
jgi:hypothetical protein